MLGGQARAGDPSTLVVVAVPDGADAAMVEALHRLRGEATAVGFEVRVVGAAGEAMTPGAVDKLWAEWHPAAVVTVVRPRQQEPDGRALDLSFALHPGDQPSVAHVTVADVVEPERADVILAVRAVDFIRARMFDALVDRRGQSIPAPAPPSPPPPARARGLHLAAGLVLLGGPSGFSPQLAPRLALGFRPLSWLQLSGTGLGFGLEAERSSDSGKVSVDQRFLALEVSLLLPRVWRLEPVLSLSGGEVWARTRGEASVANIVGQSVTRSSPAGAATLGIALALGHGLSGELYAGTLWLQDRVNIEVTTSNATVSLGTVGLPTVFGGVSLNADF